MSTGEKLLTRVREALDLATKWALKEAHDDGHWCGEVMDNATFTAEYISLLLALGLDVPNPGSWIKKLLSQQHQDGGWAGFDWDNNKVFLDNIPFSDTDAMCDPSTPDVTGDALEALGLVLQLGSGQLPAALTIAMEACVESYNDIGLAGTGLASNATQTAWALLGLLTRVPYDHPSILRGIQFLLQRLSVEDDAGTWVGEPYVGTGFPRHLYMNYAHYKHYFPVMALARYAKLAGGVLG
ncbi:terpenoid cyclases/protein prenyltransferase alpha-alpha toroid [Aspergillus unguis]